MQTAQFAPSVQPKLDAEGGGKCARNEKPVVFNESRRDPPFFGGLLLRRLRKRIEKALRLADEVAEETSGNVVLDDRRTGKGELHIGAGEFGFDRLIEFSLQFLSVILPRIPLELRRKVVRRW